MRTAKPPSPVDEARERAYKRRLWELSAAGRQRGPTDVWHRVGTAGEPNFRGPFWGNYGQGYMTLRFRKDQMGFVYIAGVVQGGPSGSTVFILPVNYRPLFYTLALASLDAYFTEGKPWISVETDGKVRAWSQSASGIEGIAPFGDFYFQANG